MPRTLAPMVFWENRLSRMVGISSVEPDTVPKRTVSSREHVHSIERMSRPDVRSVGPIPKIPSKLPSNPVEWLTPAIRWELITRPLPKSTLSVSASLCQYAGMNRSYASLALWPRERSAAVCDRLSGCPKLICVVTRQQKFTYDRLSGGGTAACRRVFVLQANESIGASTIEEQVVWKITSISLKRYWTEHSGSSHSLAGLPILTLEVKSTYSKT